MNIKEFAESISGFEYPARELSDHSETAKELGFLFCYGMSDDLFLIGGVYSDETYAYNGYKTKLGTKGVKVEAVFSPSESDDDNRTWLIKADCPHETFSIMEDGQIFCTGVVIHKDDLNV